MALVVTGFEVFWQDWNRDVIDLLSRLKNEASFAVSFAISFAISFSTYIDGKRVFYTEKHVPSEEKLAQLFKKKRYWSSIRHEIQQKLAGINLSIISAIALILIPKCPMCWAAWMSVLSGLGFGVVEYQSWLSPFMSISLVLSGGLAVYQAYKRKKHIYLALMIAGISLVLTGKLLLNINVIMYGGLAFMSSAWLWMRLQLLNPDTFFPDFLKKCPPST